MRGKVRVVPVAQIEYITASGPYVELHTSERAYLIREAIHTLEERLDPNRFLRIHRSIIVRVDLIDTFHRGARPTQVLFLYWFGSYCSSLQNFNR